MGQCILLQDDKLPCVSLSRKCRSLRVNSVTRSVRAQENSYMHACLTLSHCLRHTIHALASDVIFARKIDRSHAHAFLSSKWHVLSCLPPAMPSSLQPSLQVDRDGPGQARGAGAAHGRTRRPFHAHAYTLYMNNGSVWFAAC